MDQNTPEPPYYDDDESDHEIESDDSDGFEFDDNDDMPESEPADNVEESGSISPSSIIDLVADGKATEVKQQIFQSLYSRVGERLDAMKAETRGRAFNQSEE